MTPEETLRINDELELGRAHIELQLRTKLDFWNRLPWLLVALAHVDEMEARAAARRAVEMFNLTPYKELHHRKTWKWLQPGGALRAHVDNFIAGSPRMSLPPWVLRLLAEFRFIIIVESSIEAKHSKVKLSSAWKIGPVRISLANRLALIEQMISKDVQGIQLFCSYFEKARNIIRIPQLLGFERHPSLMNCGRAGGGVGKHWTSMISRIVSIIYRVNIDDVYASYKVESDDHTRKKRAHEAKEVRIAITEGLHEVCNVEVALCDIVSAQVMYD